VIPVTVASLSMSNAGFVVLLKSQQDERTLPIFIGLTEAQAIHFHLNEVKLPRPMTHDLLKNVLDVLEARLERIEIWNLKEGTFYGRLILSFEGQTLEVDSRPSDAIALAMRCSAPVFVAEEVMEEAALILGSSEQNGKESSPEEEDDVSRLKRELDAAIAEERYEDAARLRDQIKGVKNAN